MESYGPTMHGQHGFGALLKRYRLAAGLSQEALAERARLSARAIRAYEQGHRRAPYRDTVGQLVQALGLSKEEAAALEATVPRWRGRVDGPPLWGPAQPPRQSPLAPGNRATGRSAEAPPLVGRTREVTALERHLAGEGPPLLLLAGEPGIGKSRLLVETCGRAHASGWQVLQGGCQRRSGQVPYAPLLEALKTYIQRCPRADLRTELRGCAWLVRLLPELANGPIEPLPGWALPPEQERRLMFEAVARFLANITQTAARPAPTVLLLDDLQWAGTDALDLLAILVRSTALPTLRVVGTYRDTEAPPGSPLAEALADLAHAGLVRHHALRPLTPQEAGQLLDALLGGLAEEAKTLKDRVVQRAGGVPFYLALGRLAEARRAADEAVTLAEAAGDLQSLPQPLYLLSVVYLRRGDLERSAQYCERELVVVERKGESVRMVAATAQRGLIAYVRGDWPQARKDGEQALALSRQIGTSWASPMPLTVLGLVSYGEGRLEEARGLLEECVSLAARVGQPPGEHFAPGILAECDVLGGQPAQACAHLAPLLDELAPAEADLSLLLTPYAWAQLGLGEVAAAAEMVGQAITLARARNDQLNLVDALRVQALVRVRQRDWERAALALEEGLALARDLPYPYAEARLLYLYGEVCVHAGQPELARERLEAALTIFRRLGARKDIEQSEQLLAIHLH